MKILIEEYRYEADAVKEVLQGLDPLMDMQGKVSVHYVGYYYNYNSSVKDCVFILPKVLLKESGDDKQEKVFGEYRPEDIINPEGKLKQQEKDFIYKLAVWVYRAIVVYKNSHPENTIVCQSFIHQVGRGRRRLSNTYLDILLSLIQFNRDNRNLFFFILKNLHSGYDKINWTRTISTTDAIVQRGKPVYLNPVNKKRQVDFDEELLVIFFSILNYVGDTYGFAKEIDCHFQLIKGKQFETYLKGFGCTRLLQIKYKYFSDKDLELWGLCYAFFDESRKVFVNTRQKEYLLVKDFYIVFEAIIDELIGDRTLPDNLKKRQEDGKVLDHIFRDASLIDSRNRKTYYIGDSKYYKIGHELTKESIYKQYTYAHNVIQWNLNLFNDEKEENPSVRLRDDVTEGYNIIPNFFISAKMYKDGNGRFSYGDDGIERTDRKHNRHSQFQFKNRLFDRDTLLLFHYDVNFLFVLSLYARNNASQKAVWKEKVRRTFREEIQEWLKKDYDFYAMRALPGVDGEAYIKGHFQEVLGKLYAPYTDKGIISLALDNKCKPENDALIDELRRYFYVELCPLGQDPNKALPAVATGAVAATIGDNDLALCVTRMGDNYGNFIGQLKAAGKMGIALNMDGATLQLVEGFTNVRYVIVHNKSKRYSVFYTDGKGPKLVAGDDIGNMPVTKKGASLYLVYSVKKEAVVGLPELDLTPIALARSESYYPQLLPVQALLKKAGA
ncbi:MAG: LlaJI family restriction endonuclease [Prevotellaceae bacterium]|nr:LlaJI family restriction endonuclease [Prevotellaceae bacterium]